MGPARHRNLIVGLVVALLAVPWSAAAAGGAQPVSDELQTVREAIAPARRLVEPVRAAAAEGGLSEVLAAAIRAGGHAVSPPPLDVDLDSVLPNELTEALAALPGDLAAPLADLAAAVYLAYGEVGRATRGVPDPLARRVLASEVTGSGDHRLTGEGRGVRLAEPVLRLPSAHDIDMRALHGAALRVTDAMDRNLHHLQAAAESLPSSAGRVEGCDVLDVGPVCVGGTGPNRYTEEKVLLVDLGGDSVFENSAGGASNVVPGFFPLSVVLNLAGDDTYHHEVSTTQEAVPSQGSGTWGGVGILVDVEGDDTYLRTFCEEEGARQDGQVAQGAAEVGVGLLADLEGDDTYAVELGEDIITFHQGAANGPGTIALLVDREAGDDDYELVGGTAVVERDPAGGLAPSARFPQGQGLGMIGGTGVLIDDGGSDTFSLSASTEVPEDVRSYVELFDQGAYAHAQLLGQGTGFAMGAVGLLLAGEGSTSYRAEATGRGLGKHSVLAQGFGANAAGVLDDLGGDDVYLLRSEMAATAAAVADEGCDCEANATIDASALVNAQMVAGQGASGIPLLAAGVLGVLHDHGGDDRYTVIHEGTVTAEARATGPDLSARAEAISFSAGPVWAQGVAEIGTGALVNESGDDHYVVRVHHRASARALGDAGVPAEARAEAAQRDEVLVIQDSVLAQGATQTDGGVGVLADLGGSDRYEVVVRTEADAYPTIAGARESRGLGPFQGSGPNGLLLDIDAGEPDTFVSEPNFYRTCTGHRGEPTVWSECPTDRRGTTPTAPFRLLGTGILTSGASKDDVTLDIEDFRHLPEGGLLVEGTLIGPDGEPPVGRFIDVRIQGEASGVFFGHPSRWKDVTASHGRTDADGRWEAALRLADLQDAEGVSAPFRLWAGFSGDETLRSGTATEPFAP